MILISIQTIMRPNSQQMARKRPLRKRHLRKRHRRKRHLGKRHLGKTHLSTQHAAAWSCERPGEACDGVRARSTTGTATCRLSPARDAAHPYRASGAGPGRPSYTTAGLCGPYGHSPTATRCAAGDRLAPVHQEGRCACLA
ncbi:unnamed protein product [Boreogadus saida]